MLNTRKKAQKNTSEMSELEERYQEVIVTTTAAAKKEKEAHDTRNDAKKNRSSCRS